MVLLAIPHRRYDAIRVEQEINGRVLQIEIPPWSIDDLRLIPWLGFKALHAELAEPIVTSLAAEAVGSPHLAQEFCQQMCRQLDLTQTLLIKRTYALEEIDLHSVFRDVARNASRTVFDGLAKGRSGRVRKLRYLADGTAVDTYDVVLRAVANLRPNVGMIEYVEIARSLRALLADGPPALREVSRVLETMSTISANDDASCRPLDWEKDARRLHISDPFFAFFLKWGIADD